MLVQPACLVLTPSLPFRLGRTQPWIRTRGLMEHNAASIPTRAQMDVLTITMTAAGAAQISLFLSLSLVFFVCRCDRSPAVCLSGGLSPLTFFDGGSLTRQAPVKLPSGVPTTIKKNNSQNTLTFLVSLRWDGRVPQGRELSKQRGRRRQELEAVSWDWFVGFHLKARYHSR